MFGASNEEKLCINLNIGNTVLQQAEFSKYVGIYIDSDFYILTLILAGSIILVAFTIKSLNLLRASNPKIFINLLIKKTVG